MAIYKKAKRKRARASRKKPPKPAACVTGSDNRKTGPVAVTYAAQQSCPQTCPFLGSGCYAETGPMGSVTSRLNGAATGMSPYEIACAEAAAIRAAPANTDLRIHGVGDCRTELAAFTVAAAATEYVRRGSAFKVRAWTYTHAWRLVPRAAWLGVSALASVESYGDAAKAMSHGYAAAVVVPEFPDGATAYTIGWEKGGPEDITVVPCPYQTKGVQCVKCRLCLDDRKLLEERRVIAFAAHGSKASSVKRTLKVITGE